MEKVVQPPATLRFYPASMSARIEFCKAHGLRNEYLQDMVKLGRSEHKGWQRLDKVRWLQHVKTGELVVVVGKPKYFIDTVAKKRADMPFQLRCFERLLAGDYKTCTDTVMDVYKSWKVMHALHSPLARIHLIPFTFSPGPKSQAPSRCACRGTCDRMIAFSTERLW